MARKSMGKASKVLGGLGAAYALSKLPVGRGVRLGDPEADARIAKTTAEFSRRPLYEPAAAEQAERALEDARRREGLPVLTPERQAEHLREFPEIARSGAGLPIRTYGGFLTTDPALSRKKGGTVKGWGKARGARKAKVY